MAIPEPLSVDRLYTRCSPEDLDFTTTEELEEMTHVVGQARAERAIRFGVDIRREGYNLYAMGSPGMGKHNIVRRYLESRAADRETPPDWCYVHNFAEPHRPRVLRMPAGKGCALRDDMSRLIDDLSGAIPAAFESEDYRAVVGGMEQELKSRQEEAFESLERDATKHGIKLFRTPAGYVFAPLRDGEVVGPAEFEQLPEDERKRIQGEVSRLQDLLADIVKKIPLWGRETREKVRSFNREVTRNAVSHAIEDLQHQYAGFPEVIDYLSAVENDVIENADDFRATESSGNQTEPRELHRYQVNVLVDNSTTRGAPVVYLDHPTFQDLLGRIEHVAQFGTLVTDFTLLKPGALHRANGGYLMIDAHKVLTNPFAWDGLKRALYAGALRIESVDRMLSLVSTVSLDPAPIPLDVKVVLLGDRMLYYLLYEYDPDFAELFKVAADFDERLERSPENTRVYARLIATLARREALLPLERGAVARVIEHAARQVEDSEHLSTHMRSMLDLLREADHWARDAGRQRIEVEDVRNALQEQRHRASRIKERLQEEITRGTVHIATSGEVVGQINGLSVLSMGYASFGQPSRITATVHLGEGHVVDIEREVELGGALHSKGVMILSSFLTSRFARRVPLALSANLVFEQNYGGVEGDSASMAELCALVSAIAEQPIRQSLAITGSVDQFGRAQAIGGVNEKIEGFFDICKTRGLDGSNGVLIPASNVPHLMLGEEVIDAVEAGRFHIWPFQTVDEAIELLTGRTAGEPDPTGDYAADTIYGKVQARLREMAELRQAFGDGHHGKDGD